MLRAAVVLFALAGFAAGACSSERETECPIMCAQIGATSSGATILAIDSAECLPEGPDFASLSGITEIEITNSSVTTMPNGYMNIGRTITRFSLTDSALHTLGNLSLADFNLLTIDLSRNQLTDLTDRELLWMDHIRTFNVSDNKITALATDMRMTALTVLDVSGNKLTKVSAALGASFPALTHLHAADNAISIIESGAFGAASALTHVDLAANQLGRYPLEAQLFRFAPHVTFVNMSHNPLSNVPRYFFRESGHKLNADLHVTALVEPPGSAKAYNELYVDPAVLSGRRAKAFFGDLRATLKIYDRAHPFVPAEYNCVPGDTDPETEGEDCAALARAPSRSSPSHSNWGVITLGVAVPVLIGVAAVAWWHHRKTHPNKRFSSGASKA